MNLKPLVKLMYSTEEVCSRWHEIHEDYNMDFLQEKIASGEISAYLNLKNCYLFPVDEVEKSYDYLEICDVTEGFKSKIILSFFVKGGVFKSLQNKTIYKSEINDDDWPTKSKMIGSLVIPSDLGVIKPIYLYHVVNSCDLLNPSFSIETSKALLKGPNPLNSNQPVIKVSDCGVPVTPWYWVKPLGVFYIPKDVIPRLLEALNLSPKKDALFEGWLGCCSVVEFNETFYYVVNEKSYEFEGSVFNGYSLSQDVFNSYFSGQGVVLKKEDIEKFEKNLLSSMESDLSNSKGAGNNKAEISKQDLLMIFNELVTSFGDSKEFRRDGKNTEQEFIKDWIQAQPYDLRSHHVRTLKELISAQYEISTARNQKLS
jgi:hypothetical protein